MPLRIHFLNVGHGDCTLIEHPSGRITMIDINNSKSLPESDTEALASMAGLSVEQFRSAAYAPAGFRTWEGYYQSLLVDPVDFFRGKFPYQTVFRYVQTHPDMDHLSGLYRFFWQEGIDLENVWDVTNSKEILEADCEGSRYNYLDWLAYQLLQMGRHGEDGSHKVLNLAQGAEAPYYRDDNISILGPSVALSQSCDERADWNNLSYVLRVTHAGRSVVLPGDAESAAWDSILEAHDADEIECDVLKASHHGRESGYSADAVSVMAPSFVVCSVGKKPSTDASDEYRRHGSTVLSTRYQGSISIEIDDYGAMAITNCRQELIGSLGALRSWKIA